MSTFAGIVRFDGARTDIQTEARIRRAVAASGPEAVHVMHADGALFVQRVTAPSGSGLHDLAGGAGRAVFAASARLDNREELADALNIPRPELIGTSDATLLYGMLNRWGDAGVARCLGAFAFARWDDDRRCLTLGRDCLGNRPLYFHRGHGFAAFATTLGALFAIPQVPRALDDIELANLLALNLRDVHRTLYRGIDRVPSRTLIAIGGAAIDRRHYWSPDVDAPPPYRREQDYIERARELLDRAVASAIHDTPRVAIAASGGLDSSAVAATAARLGMAERITCYTLVPVDGTRIAVSASKYLDERPKMAALARMHPALDIRYMAPETAHPVEDINASYFARWNAPNLNPANLGAFSFIFDAALSTGHRRLLTGSAGNFGLSWPGHLSLAALWQDGQWRAFAHELTALARETGRGVAKTWAAETLLRTAPALRRSVHRLRGHDPDSVAHYSMLNPGFIAEHDLMARWREQGFDPSFSPPGLPPARIRAERLFDRNQFARDSAGGSYELRGIEIADPHSDRRLLEFLLTVPEPMYRRDGIPRSFARAVLADRLPPDILDERRRGVQDANWFRRLDGSRHAIAADIDSLEGSPLARRVLDLPRLKRLMSEWPADEHAAQLRSIEYHAMLGRAVHVGRFIRWVEGGNE